MTTNSCSRCPQAGAVLRRSYTLYGLSIALKQKIRSLLSTRWHTAAQSLIFVYVWLHGRGDGPIAVFDVLIAYGEDGKRRFEAWQICAAGGF